MRLVRWLNKNNYYFVSETDVIEYYYNGKRIPSGAVWLTLDDGWKENLFNVIPIVNQYKIPITIFIPTGIVENDGIYWWSLLQKSRDVLQIPYSEVFKIPEKERRKLVEKVRFSSNRQLLRQAVTKDDIYNLSQYKWISFGAHTVLHPLLPNCTEDELNYEIIHSCETLAQWTKRPVNSFAYPMGKVDTRAIEVLKNLGVKVAVTTEMRPASITDDPFLLPRVSVYDGITNAEGIANVVGVWPRVIKMIKRI
ncbi:polysaccharide deacetylase family protein [Lutibacter sp.]